MKKITKLLATAIVLIVLSMAHIDSKASSDDTWIHWDYQDMNEFNKVVDYKLGETINLTIPSSVDGVNPSNIILLKIKPDKIDNFTIIANGEYMDNIYVYREFGYPDLAEIEHTSGLFNNKNFAPYEVGCSFFANSEYTYYIAIASAERNVEHSVRITSTRTKMVDSIQSVTNTPVIIGNSTSGFVTAKVKYTDGEIRTIYGDTNSTIYDVYLNKISFEIPSTMTNDNTETGEHEVSVKYTPFGATTPVTLPKVQLSFLNKKDILKSKDVIDTSMAISTSDSKKIYNLPLFEKKYYLIGFDNIYDKSNDRNAVKILIMKNNEGSISSYATIVLDSKTKFIMRLMDPGQYYFIIAPICGNVNCRISEVKADIAVESVNLPTSKTVKAGTNIYLGDELTVTPEYANVQIYWSSSNPSVASVSKSGTVVTKAGGTAQITVNAGGKTSTCVVTVKRKNQKIKSFGIKQSNKLITKKTYRKSDLKKRNKSVILSASATDSNSRITYSIKSVSKKKPNGKYENQSRNKFSIDNQRLVIKRGLKKGTYKIIVTVKARQTGMYNKKIANKNIFVIVK